ncbi:hypothetical protein [Shimia sp. FJ5]|uniref:hypothetical protein n=1 Tax=Shimia sp. FJ5 TaxID=3079054 RepID=UPI0026282212|nr:hypothetical protein [Shimia sp. FJ5]MDV4145344.1 hypothetical protein [Shimia sp. FJ5]
MKPEFALSLSFEGISLLYRIEGGWHLMGEAALTSETLGADLEALRDTAESIGGKAFRTKLVLPNEQIKYLSLSTGKIDREARIAAVSAELEATTPYGIDELAFDLTAAGPETHVAAVARETLVEAEAFAVEHAFNPVCFVAIPPAGTFSGEPFFGQTEIAPKLLKKDTAKPDELPIHVISSGPLPEPKPEPEPIAAPEPAPASGLATAPAAPKPEAEPELPLAAAPEASAPALETKATPQEVEDATDPPAAPEVLPDAAPTPSFGSRRSSAAPLRAERTAETAPRRENTLTASREDGQALRFDPARVAAGLRPQQTEATDDTDGRGRRLAENASGAVVAATAFLSRRREARRARRAAGSAVPAEAAATNERQRMMVFGARSTEIGGKPRYLGLALTVVLLVFLAAVAAWASLFMDEGLAGLFRRDPPQQIADSAPESQPVENLETAALPPVSPDTITDSAEIEAMTDADHPTALDGHEAEARYAATGIWQRAPDQALTPESGSTDDLYLTSIDRVVIAKDAVALPALKSYATDRPLPRQMSPLPRGLDFDMDERGLVKATPDGALSPEGILVYLGKPPVLPAAYPVRKAAPGEALPPVERARIATLRPRLRPEDLIEQNERASNGGRTLAELSNMRPRLRPETEKAEEEAEDTTATQYAVTASLRPKPRPQNFEAIVARADPAERVEPTAAVATVTPSIPSSASVARQATIQNAMNLRKVNLIGVYGTSNSRRALVRLSNGRFKKVKVGDRIDGGKVAAIGDTELRYIKSGKNVVLKLPRG